MAKFRKIPESETKYQIQFWCPGCDMIHSINDGWDFNNDFDNPTLSPSILAHGYSYKTKADFVCHSFIKNGMIRFLNDCTHQLAGQTVELPQIEGKP